MPAPEQVISESPVRFEHAVAYALHPDMRRLIILYVVGLLLTPVGMSWFMRPVSLPIIDHVLGLAVTIIGAIFLFSGLVGTLFKLVTDANRLAYANLNAE